MFAKFVHQALLASVVFLASLMLAGTRGWAADVEFRWAIMADSPEGMQALDFHGSPVVHSGTALQIYLEHLNNCHIYMFLLDSTNSLSPLYPMSVGYYDYGFPRGPKMIPPGEQSFTFVPPAGIETFYLLASENRLFQIERMTEEMVKNPNSVGQQKLLIDSLEALLKDKENRSIRGEDLEKTTYKVRTAKGIEERTVQVVEVDISHFYGRKLLVDHR